MKISTSAQTRAVKSYREAFPENSTKRGVADHLLASLDSPKETVESLCRGLGVLGGEKARRAELAEAEQLRQQTEIESSRTDLDQTQKNWPITTQFECGSCNRNIDWMQGARNHVCHYCKVTLMLPPHMTCPFCGGVNIQIMSKPQYKFTFAGALIYGPAGLLVGTLIDSALDGSKQVIREKIKNPVFCCESCKKYWGIKMPVAIREGGRMIPSSEKGNNIMVELEKLGELKKQGLLTEEEFLAAKSKIIG